MSVPKKILGLEVILFCRLSDEGHTRNYGQLSGSWLLLCWNCKVCMVMIISFSVSGIDYLWNEMIYSQGEHAMKFILRVFLEHQGRRPWLIGLLLIFCFLMCHPPVALWSSGMRIFSCHWSHGWSLSPAHVSSAELSSYVHPQSGHSHHLNSPSW